MLKLNGIVQTGLSVVLVVMVYSAFLSGVWNPSYGYFLWVGEVFGENPISQLLITFSMFSWLAGIAFVAYFAYYFFYRDVLIGHIPTVNVLLALFLSVFFLYLISFVFFEYETFTLDTADHFYTGSLRERLLLVVTYLVMVPIFEEIFFRGIMMGAILNMPLITNEKVRMATACIIPSLLFISLHTQYEYVWTYILLFLFAIVVSVARIISRGLLLPMLLHSFAIVCAISFSFLSL